MDVNKFVYAKFEVVGLDGISRSNNETLLCLFYDIKKNTVNELKLIFTKPKGHRFHYK